MTIEEHTALNDYDLNLKFKGEVIYKSDDHTLLGADDKRVSLSLGVTVYRTEGGHTVVERADRREGEDVHIVSEVTGCSESLCRFIGNNQITRAICDILRWKNFRLIQ